MKKRKKEKKARKKKYKCLAWNQSQDILKGRRKTAGDLTNERVNQWQNKDWGRITKRQILLRAKKD